MKHSLPSGIETIGALKDLGTALVTELDGVSLCIEAPFDERTYARLEDIRNTIHSL